MFLNALLQVHVKACFILPKYTLDAGGGDHACDHSDGEIGWRQEDQEFNVILVSLVSVRSV